MAKGNFTRKVFLRKRDFLHGEALLVNEILDRLNADGHLLKTHLELAKKSAEALMNATPAGQAKEHLLQILQSAEACHAALESWTVTSDQPGEGPNPANVSIPTSG
jgi:hypothetical protein